MTALDSFPVSIQQPKCPKLDSTLKAQVPKACKDGDGLFCRLRILVLDAVGPLTRVLELPSKRATSHRKQPLRSCASKQGKRSYLHRKTAPGHRLPQQRLASIGGGTRQVQRRSSCPVRNKLCPVREGPC